MNSPDRVAASAQHGWRAATLAIESLGFALTVFTAHAADAIPSTATATNWVDTFIGQLQSSRKSGEPSTGYGLVWKEGKVSVTPYATGKENRDAPKGVELKPRDRLATPTGARAILLQLSEATAVHEQTELSVAVDNSLELKSGTFYVKSLAAPTGRINIRTPVGLVEWKGTEFQLEVDKDTGKTTLVLNDGVVMLSSTNGAAGQFDSFTASAAGAADFVVGVMAAGEGPRKPTADEQPAVKTFNQIIQWVLYYPAVLDLAELPSSLAEERALQESLAAYRKGDLPTARAAYPPDRFEAQSGSAAERVYRAALLTAFGQIDEVERSLAPLVSATSSEPSAERARRLARAFLTLIAAVRHDDLGPRPPLETLQLRTERLAESYYLQSRSDDRENIEHALKAAQAAAATNAFGGFGFAQGRVADLEFSRGHTAAAQAALKQARDLAPENPQLLVLEGYLFAAAGQVKKALDSFKQAVAKDGRLGDAWLGLGLCLIRQGQAEAGLRFLQMAVAREPQRATLKSYLGKGYEALGQRDAALKELRSAKRTDPQDPTP